MIFLMISDLLKVKAAFYAVLSDFATKPVGFYGYLVRNAMTFEQTGK
jgi:hypothetical protein